MAFEKLKRKQDLSQHQSWRNIIVSIVKYREKFRLRICFRSSLVKKIGIKAGKPLDIFIGVDDDERKIMIASGSSFKATKTNNQDKVIRIDLPTFEDHVQHIVRFQECPFVVIGKKIIIELPDSIYTYKSNKDFNSKHYHPILSPQQIRYLKACGADPQNNVKQKLPGFLEKIQPKDRLIH